MAYSQEPQIEMDDLHPRNHGFIESYKATWQERGVIAYAYLEPIDDQPARGYVLETTYQTVSGRDPGPRQSLHGVLLTQKLREHMTKQMINSGWQPIPIPGTSRMGWQHESRLKRVDPVKQGELVLPKKAASRKEDELEKARRQLDADIAERRALVQAEQEQVRVTLSSFGISPYIDGEARRNYEAVAVLGDVQAIIAVLPLRDRAYPGAYFLQTGIDRFPFVHVPGTALPDEQKQRANALLPGLRLQVEAALVTADWSVRWQHPRFGNLWTSPDWQDGRQAREVQQEQRAETPQTQQITPPVEVPKRVLTVTAKAGSRHSKSYQRTITAQTVTLTCSCCGQETTALQFPGRTPRYCEACRKQVTREQTRARVTRLRIAHRETPQ